MLSGSNDEKLTNKKVDLKVVPFYQVWQELVHVQTLDVYQYRVLTSFSALKELLSVIKKALCYIRDNYDVFVALYKENQKGILEADVLSTGIISLI